jgi:hypothetical protein
MKPVERLRLGLNYIVEEADHAASVASAEASGQAAMNGGLRNSRTAILHSNVVEQILHQRLPAMFRIYTQERERFWSDPRGLKEPVRESIEQYFQLAARHIGDRKATIGSTVAIYDKLLAEARERALVGAEAHFLHPGVRYWHERNALKFAAVCALIGALATKAFGG